MDQLIELLQQIQDLAGVAIDALKGASKDAGGEGKPPMEHEAGGGAPGGGAPPEGGKPPEGKPAQY